MSGASERLKTPSDNMACYVRGGMLGVDVPLITWPVM